MKPIYFILLLGLVACGAERESDLGDGIKKEYTTEPSTMEMDTTVTANYSMQEETESEEYVPVSPPQDINNGLPTSPDLPDIIVPKLIHTADIRFRVENLEKVSDMIDDAAKKYGGYVSTANLTSSNNESVNTLSIKIPSTNFDVFLKDICKNSTHMDRKNISTQDVTEEHVDIEARLKNKREAMAKYEAALKNKAKTTEDVIKTEEQIRAIQEEIEAKEGRLNYLKNQVAYSTVSIQIYQQIEYKENPDAVTESFGSKAGSGFSIGWNVVQTILIGMITVWPILLIAGLTFYFVRKKLKAA